MGEAKKRVVSMTIRCIPLGSCGQRHLGIWMPASPSLTDAQCYFFDSDIGNYHYGPGEYRCGRLGLDADKLQGIQ